MALFDLEPPSSKETKESKTIKLDSVTSRLQKTMFWKNEMFVNQNKEKISRFFSATKIFLSSNKYLPHIALVILGSAVSVTNVTQKMAAKAYAAEMTTINPDALFSVSQSMDYYTPIIKNDSTSVEKVILASATPDGFVSNSISVATEVTDRNNLVATAIAADNTPDNSVKTITYTIQNGDTLTSLGWKYGVKLATLKYVNNIENENLIKPGVDIKIPPKGYEVSATLIAKRANDQKAKLAAASRNTVTRNTTAARTSAVNAKPGSKNNAYPYGWCTYYVATRRAVPGSWGDAKSWLSSAQRAGYSTGKSPVVGAIMVSSESFWGHVAYVESVDGDSFTISEMNYKGWGVTSRRTVSIGSGIVRGFIY